MAIYKPPKARWPVAVFVGALGLLLGLGLGFALGQEEPDAAEGVRLVQQELAAAAAGLEVAEIEYTEAVDDSGVVEEVEYQGSLDTLESSRARYESVHDALAALAPDQAEEILESYKKVANAMRDTAPPDHVSAVLSGLSRLLKGETG